MSQATPQKPDDKRANTKAKILIAKDLGAVDDQLKDMTSEELDETITYLKTKKVTNAQFIDPSKNVGSPPSGFPDPADPASVKPENISVEERFNAAVNPRHPSKGRRYNNDARLLMLFNEQGVPTLF